MITGLMPHLDIMEDRKDLFKRITTYEWLWIRGDPSSKEEITFKTDGTVTLNSDKVYTGAWKIASHNQIGVKLVGSKSDFTMEFNQ